MTLFPPCLRLLTCCAVGLLLSACNTEPELPWQTVQFTEAGIEAAFPCTPQLARRAVDFGFGESVSMQMMGCDAAESTFALSNWLLEDPAQTQEALIHWQAAVLAGLTPEAQANSGAAFTLAGSLDLPNAIRVTASGVGPSGWSITTHGVWFARAEGTGARIFHAVVYSPGPQPAVAERFFARLRLY